LDYIDTINDSDLRDSFRLAFASTMVRYSNYSYEPSLGRRVSAGKEEILDFPVIETVIGKLGEMAEDVEWMQANVPSKQGTTNVINDSFFYCRSHLAAESVDLIVTSPPYLNNYHYNRNTRPQLYWLGYATRPQDLKSLEAANFGKFWQTVREQDCLDLNFSLPNTDLAERLQALRKLNPERGIYGGNGWANYAAAYFNDSYRFAQGIQYTLRSGGTALVVIGNSILQGILIPTDFYFGKIAESLGLELVNIDIPRATRVGNSIIQSAVRVAKAKETHQLYEAVVELRKSDHFKNR
jgi:DNA modification methylase